MKILLKLRIFLLYLPLILVSEIVHGQLLCNNVDPYGNIPTYYNQQNVNFDYANSLLTISYFDCDPCKTGMSFIECRNRKICQSNCEQLFPENPHQIIEECVRDCEIEFPNGPNSIHHCQGYCMGLPYVEYNNCLSECGTIPNIRQPIYQITQIKIWYTTNISVPFYQGTPNFNVKTQIELYNGNNLTFNLNRDFGNEPLSYCIITETIVKYNDGSCCRFFNNFCVNIG